jgi:hypothetical protein
MEEIIRPQEMMERAQEALTKLEMAGFQAKMDLTYRYCIVQNASGRPDVFHVTNVDLWLEANAGSIMNHKTLYVVFFRGGSTLGTYLANSELEARDLCAQDAGYLDEADMVKRLGQPSDLIAVPAVY